MVAWYRMVAVDVERSLWTLKYRSYRVCHEKCPFFFIITSFPDLKKVQIRSIISAKHCCVPSEILYSEHNRGENRQVAEQSSALSGASPGPPPRPGEPHPGGQAPQCHFC